MIKVRMHHVAACDGKERFASPQEAHHKLKHIKTSGQRLRVYQCLRCGYWHYGRSNVGKTK